MNFLSQRYVLLSVASIGVALPLLLGAEQQSRKLEAVPNSLEDRIAAALSANPDLLLAKAKVREAQAELNRQRLKVTQAVTAVHSLLRTQEVMIQSAAVTLDVVAKKYKTGHASAAEVSQAKVEFRKASAKQGDARGQLRYLLGIGGRSDLRSSPDLGRTESIALASRSEDVPEKISESLSHKMDITFDDVPLAEAMQTLGERTGLTFVFGPSIDLEMLLSLHLPDVEFAHALLAIADAEEIYFVIRNYGVLVTDREQAKHLDGATIPGGVPLER